MKSKLILVLFMLSIFACQNTDNEEQLSWQQQIDKEIIQFEKNSKISKKVKIVERQENYFHSLHQSNQSAIIKYTSESDLKEVYPIKFEIYLKDNNVFFVKWSGLMPYLRKGKRDENTKCCETFEQTTYFKNSKEAYAFYRKIDLKSIEEFSEAKIKLSELPFEDKPVEDINELRDRIYASVEDIKTQLNKIQ